MTLIELIILLAAIVLVCLAAYWIIIKFFPEPYRTPALIVVGIIALVFLLIKFFPAALNVQVGG